MPEDGAGRDPGPLEPRLIGPHRARLLVGAVRQAETCASSTPYRPQRAGTATKGAPSRPEEPSSMRNPRRRGTRAATQSPPRHRGNHHGQRLPSVSISANREREPPPSSCRRPPIPWRRSSTMLATIHSLYDASWDTSFRNSTPRSIQCLYPATAFRPAARPASARPGSHASFSLWWRRHASSCASVASGASARIRRRH